MKGWCTYGEVVQALQVLQWDEEDSRVTLPPIEVDEIIKEATTIVRSLVSPNYNVIELDAMNEAGSLPDALRNLAKIAACRILITRRGLDAISRNEGIRKMMDEQYNYLLNIISSGLLLDNLGAKVIPQATSAYYSPQFNQKFTKVLYPNDLSRTY